MLPGNLFVALNKRLNIEILDNGLSMCQSTPMADLCPEPEHNKYLSPPQPITTQLWLSASLWVLQSIVLVPLGNDRHFGEVQIPPSTKPRNTAIGRRKTVLISRWGVLH